ncbi:MAG: DNA mismatch repair protein MutS, partial [Proteobacteria bacterium]|nr:DNA mismatch repair protein MutS [Pseudomonadota bacterium]
GEVSAFNREHLNYLDATIALFEREIQFYLAYMEYIAILKKAGLKFCYPQISTEKNNIYSQDGFDLALAHQLVSEKAQIVTNDFYLQGAERIIIVTGPNQGGKTTFARTFGQLHYLACIGCPTPGNQARLFLFDHLFTHFEQEEDITRLQGKLENDLVRIHDILNRATIKSILIMNEILTSTTLQDAIFLSQKLIEKIIELDLLCVWVTFIDELASFNEKIVSMASTVAPNNPDLRTFKIIRKPAEGLAYALSIAEKYRLTYSQLVERIQP